MANIAFSGRLSRDVEMKFSGSGKAIATLNVAENHSRMDKNTNKYIETGTTWRRVTVFGKRAEALANLRKGAVLAIQGREETREYEKQDGSKGSSLEVIADIVGVLPTSVSVDRQNAPQQPNAQQQGGWGNQPQQNAWGASQDSGWGNTEEAPF